MKKLWKFHRENPVVAEGVRAINDLYPRTNISYLTYRSWVMRTGRISMAYRLLLLTKGIRA